MKVRTVYVIGRGRSYRKEITEEIRKASEKLRKEDREKLRQEINSTNQSLRSVQTYMATKHFYYEKTREQKAKFYERQRYLLDYLERLAIEAEEKGYKFSYEEAVSR